MINFFDNTAKFSISPYMKTVFPFFLTELAIYCSRGSLLPYLYQVPSWVKLDWQQAVPCKTSIITDKESKEIGSVCLNPGCQTELKENMHIYTVGLYQLDGSIRRTIAPQTELRTKATIAGIWKQAGEASWLS